MSNLLQDPNVRQAPVWGGNDLIEVYGAEWEALFNFVNSANLAYASAHSVMNRNLLNGKIKMRFEKVLPDGSTVPMTKDEEKPYQKEFNKLLAQAKEIANKAVKGQVTEAPVDDQAGVPFLDKIVDPNGEAAEAEPAGAKIITMDTQKD